MGVRLYLDTEFNGFGGELISMALVSMDNKEFYEVIDLPKKIDPWVQQNVLPVLDKEPRRPIYFRTEFLNFIKQFAYPEIYCDWYSDAVHFFNQFSGPDHSTSLDWPCTLHLLRTPPGFKLPAQVPHNALSDARALMNWHELQLQARGVA